MLNGLLERVMAVRIGELLVHDGDDVTWQGVRYRLDRYDAPEISKFRSKKDPVLERKRGYMAMYALIRLIRTARQLHLIDTGNVDARHNRRIGVLLVDGKDVASIAIEQGWGVPVHLRQKTDWGDPRHPFPELPLPPELEEQDAS